MTTRRRFMIMLTAAAFPASAAPIDRAFQDGLGPDQALSILVRAVVETLGTDRCFIYMRDPVRRMTAYTHGYSALPDWPSYGGGAWGPEPDPNLMNEPMLQKAFTDDRAVFSEDIETAPPHVLNRALEARVFGHRALIHAPLHHEGAFYGILETAVRDRPRVWSAEDRAFIRAIQPRTARLAAAYLETL